MPARTYTTDTKFHARPYQRNVNKCDNYLPCSKTTAQFQQLDAKNINYDIYILFLSQNNVTFDRPQKQIQEPSLVHLCNCSTTWIPSLNALFSSCAKIPQINCLVFDYFINDSPINQYLFVMFLRQQYKKLR